jgi:hypothetical protein
MPKKMDEAEVKKECPSCGLGVVLDSRICEFCGWDFEEEDEWILQIEKLERDLMLEKQKFEPGSVNSKIESTLHFPALERIEMKKSAAKMDKPEPARAAPAVVSGPTREARSSEVRPQTVAATEEVVQPFEKKVRTVKEAPAGPVGQAVQAAPSPKVRRVRSVKSTPPAVDEPLRDEPVIEQTKKVRVVRIVKK